MKAIEERIIPELTDEFVQNLGKFESVESFKKNVKDGLTKERKEKEGQRVRAEMIEEIAKGAETEIPDVLISSELEKMVDELRSGLENVQMKWDDYLSHVGKTSEDVRKAWRPDAEKRVRIALTLREIARKEKIEPTPEEIEQAAKKYLMQFGSAEDAKRSIDPERLREYAKGVLRNEKVFEFLEKV